MQVQKSLFLTTVSGLVLFLALVFPVLAAEAPRIEKEKLQGLLGTPELILIDVRSGADWKASTQKIKGAVREDPDRLDTWITNYPKDKTLVFYCA